MASTRSNMRDTGGPAFLSYGFRPFFLFAAIWSALAIPLWIGTLVGGDGSMAGASGRDWHVHEMLFGYLGAVVAGFLLTAVANWTGRPPVSGAPLTGVFALWLAARLASLFPPSPIIAAFDVAFFVALAALLWREVLAGGNRRNLPICVMVSLLALADLAFHLRGLIADAGPVSERAAVAIASALIALIGGRIVPAFTGNWLKQREISPPPAFNRFDKAVMALTVLALICWVVAGTAPWVGWLLMAAGLANGVRVLRWKGWRASAEALVWVLHAGYAWVAAGLLLLGAALAFPGAVPVTAGVHALTAGAIGVMTLAVMTRASRGHTGRALAADRWTGLIYMAVLLAAAVRVLAPFLPELTQALLIASSVLWTAAFGAFALCYGPMLVGRRLGRR